MGYRRALASQDAAVLPSHSWIDPNGTGNERPGEGLWRRSRAAPAHGRESRNWCSSRGQKWDCCRGKRHRRVEFCMGAATMRETKSWHSWRLAAYRISRYRKTGGNSAPCRQRRQSRRIGSDHGRQSASLAGGSVQPARAFGGAAEIRAACLPLFQGQDAPEALLLNSFFLEDIARIANHVSQNAASIGLRRYLGIDKPKETFNLLADEAALEKAVAPATMPAARWPVPGGHPLVMLQQAAVNLARSELAGGEGIIAVNGPPGTGKTTLLRDVVAACVLDRALAMAAFDDPEKAFTASGEKISAGEKAFFQLYTLAPGLKGYEMLVASSNNKAVENISKELPAAKAIGRTTDEINYFKSVSDLLHAPGKAVDADGEDEKVATEPTETWGLIAAVLGNAQNRAAFQQSFWWHENCGFRLYLKAAKGDSVVREIRDPDTGCIIERTTPSVVRNENPPSPQYAKSLWRRARNRLIALRNEIAAELKTLEAVRQSCLRLAEVRHGVVAQESACAAMQARLTPLIETTSQLKIDVATTEDQLAQRGADLKKHGQIRPGILARLFRTERWKTWLTANATLLETEVDAARQLQTSKHRLAEATAARDALAANIFKAEESLAILRQQIAQLSQAVERQRSVLGDRLVDEQFFARGHEASNIAAPWIPDRLHRKREDLFVAALAVHRAFIDASAQKVLHNLSVLMDVFSSGSMQNEAKRKLLGDLWSTLFLVVPVISTTFASVNRMLGDLPVGSIGWLLIDEAGQALPQAAVGAIMRAKRSVVVGDPLQIPPVVTLPERLTLEICNYFKVDKSVWAAPEASAQTLTDQASRFQAAFGADRGPRCVGIPLLVHRRCQEPMFGISNRIAYDGQMVHAPGPRMTGAIGAILGPSKWLDIDGEADSKWCPAEVNSSSLYSRRSLPLISLIRTYSSSRRSGSSLRRSGVGWSANANCSPSCGSIQERGATTVSGRSIRSRGVRLKQ